MSRTWNVRPGRSWHDKATPRQLGCPRREGNWRRSEARKQLNRELRRAEKRAVFNREPLPRFRHGVERER